MMLKESLISQFRDEVNNREFVYFKYNDVDGKSHWNAICSCMDWLTVAARSINGLGKLPKDIDERSVYMFSLISFVDIIDESVTTLHSVLTGVKGRKSPFEGDKSVFKGAEGKDDNDYFKELRARFGAHPVNLKGSKSGERYFASWPHDSFEGHDLTVMLYSNLKGGKDRIIHIDKSDLIAYVSKRFNYLNELITLIQQQYNEFVEWCKSTPIRIEKEPLEQVKVLVDESKKRLNSNYIEDHLKMLADLLPVTLDREEFEDKEKRFKSAMIKLVDELYDYLQNASFYEDLKHSEVFSTDALYRKNSYVLGKLMPCLLDTRYDDPMLNYYFDALAKLDNFGYGFDIEEDKKLTLAKVYMMNKDVENGV